MAVRFECPNCGTKFVIVPTIRKIETQPGHILLDFHTHTITHKCEALS